MFLSCAMTMLLFSSAGKAELAEDGPELVAVSVPTTSRAGLPNPLLPHPISKSNQVNSQVLSENPSEFLHQVILSI